MRARPWSMICMVGSAFVVTAVLGIAGCAASDPPTACGGGTHPEGNTCVPDQVVTPAGSKLQTIGLFNPLNNNFLLGPTAAGEVATRFHFGDSNSALVGMYPLAGDFDGDGKDTVALYDPRTARVIIRNANAAGPADVVVQLGKPGQSRIPLAGHFAGAGKDQLALFDPVTGRLEVNGGDEFTVGPLGFQGYPFAGDFDGDGKDTVGVYDPATGELWLKASSTSGVPEVHFNFRPKLSGMFPVAGDFDGDGKDTVALFDPSTNELFVRNTNSSGEADVILRFPFETQTWYPLVGRWAPGGPAEGSGPEWPRSTPEAQGIDAAGLAAAFRTARSMPTSHSLLVIRNGQLAAEEYFHGYTANTRNNIRSVSKSVLSALVGIALREGLLPDTKKTVAEVFPEYFTAASDPRKKAISVAHLLTMTSGLAWDENNPDPAKDSIRQWNASPNWIQFVLDQPMAADPGTKFNYSTGLTHIASGMLTRLSGMDTRAFADKHLFGPLGIAASRWDKDPAGILIGGMEVFLTPREMARFGLLYSLGGALDGKQIVPADWVAATTRPLVDVGAPYAYGGWWWLRSFAGLQVSFAWGYGGQFIFLIPARQTIVVVTSRPDGTGKASDEVSNAVFQMLETELIPALR